MELSLRNEMLNLDALAQQGVASTKRDIWAELPKNFRPFLGIVGLRGVGKTTLLRQMRKARKDGLYISADAISEKFSLFEAMEHFNKTMGIRCFLVDEIHYVKGWSTDLKKAFDFLDVEVVFTSSVALDIHTAKRDLSRRVVLKKMWPFSFREHLKFYHSVEEDTLSLSEIVEGSKKLERHIRWEGRLADYLNGQNLPFLREGGNPEAILEAIIKRDLPRYKNYTYEEVLQVRDVLTFIATAPIEDVSYTSIASNTGVSKFKVRKYIEDLEKSFLLFKVEPKGTNIKKEPKVGVMPPFRSIIAKGNVEEGTLREDFFIASMRGAGKEFFYLKGLRGEKKPDYLVEVGKERVILEIGGRSKSRAQFKGVSGKKVLLTYPGRVDSFRRPLVSVGFTY